MHSPYVKKTLSLVAFLFVLTTLGVVAMAQEETPQETMEQPVAEEAAPVLPGVVPPTDSLAMAPNDSAAIAIEVQALIKKERSGFINRVKRSGIGQNFVAGGFFMYPLLAASIIGLLFIIERLWTLTRARTNVRSLMTRAITGLREQGVQGAL